MGIDDRYTEPVPVGYFEEDEPVALGLRSEVNVHRTSGFRIWMPTGALHAMQAEASRRGLPYLPTFSEYYDYDLVGDDLSMLKNELRQLTFPDVTDRFRRAIIVLIDEALERGETLLLDGN